LNQEIDIAELKAGNTKAFEMLFRQWYEPLCRYAYAMLHNADEAEDMAQKTFCKLWDQREKVEIRTSVKSYLYKMVHNACLNKIKQWQIQSEHHETIAYGSITTDNRTEETVAYKELNYQVELAIACLPERCRQVFLLSRMQHLSYLQIAKQLQISPNTVETQIVKALKILREKLKDYLLIGICFFLYFIK